MVIRLTYAIYLMDIRLRYAQYILWISIGYQIGHTTDI